MTPKTRDELLEDYEDAYFTLLMNEYLEEEGNRLLHEFQEADARGDVPEVPQKVDRLVHDMIIDGRRRGQRREFVRRVGCGVTRVLVTVLVLIGLMTPLVLSVDAMRNPIISFILEDHGIYSTLIPITDPTQPLTSEDYANREPATKELFKGLLPNGFDYVRGEPNLSKTWLYIFKNRNNENATIVCMSVKDSSSPKIDTEDAQVYSISVAGYTGYLIEEEKSSGMTIHIIWHVPAAQRYYSVICSGLNRDRVIRLADNVARRLEALAI
ncbi:MAG: DUF4367 domain-containing protein [Oscillospiraceae bacterium]|nr:DUF4367 domain-containing protein [Oscillospiraceae bacterium]